MKVLQATEASPIDALSQLGSYGVLGLLTVAFIMGWVVPGYLHKQDREENRRLRALMEDKLFSTLEASTETGRIALASMEKVMEALHRVLDILEDPGGPTPPRRRT